MAYSLKDINICDASILTAQIINYRINAPLEIGLSLEIYDEAFLKEKDSAL